MRFGVDPSWEEIVRLSYGELSHEYREFLEGDSGYFPNIENFLNAFKTLSLFSTKYILFGQDPYPREESAIGYAFIDGKVKNLFAKDCGLSKEVNRATSLRNFMKMLFYADGVLQDDFSKEAVAKVDKSGYIQSIDELRKAFEKRGILLLNMALIFTSKEESKKHIKEWRPFIIRLLRELKGRDIKLILFGNMAKELEKIVETKEFETLFMPHPYNISFITDENAVKLFGGLGLLSSL